MPITIITDGGPEFRGKLMEEITKTWGIEHKKIAPWNHRGNGRVEVIHAIIKDMLRAFIKKYERDWDVLLPMLQFAYNTGRNTVTGYSPFHLQFGRPPTMPIDARLGNECPGMLTTEEYVEKTKANMAGIFRLVSERREKATTKAALNFNAKNRLTFFKEGDLYPTLVKNDIDVEDFNDDFVTKTLESLIYHYFIIDWYTHMQTHATRCHEGPYCDCTLWEIKEPNGTLVKSR